MSFWQVATVGMLAFAVGYILAARAAWRGWLLLVVGLFIVSVTVLLFLTGARA